MEQFYASPAGTPGDAARLGRSKYFLRQLGVDVNNAQKVTTLYQDVYPRIGAAVDGAKQVVKRLAGRFQLGVISNGLPDWQYKKLQTLGLREYFGIIVLSEEVGIRKPDPRIFHKAAALSQREPGQCLHVGDSYHTDVIGAKKAGMKACWFNQREEAIPEGSPSPEYEISMLVELLPIVE